MFWNYRVIKRTHDDGTEIFAIHEVYYDDDGKPDLVTEDPCEPQGETLEELKDDFEWYQRALEHPILNYDDFGDGDLTAKEQKNESKEDSSEIRTLSDLRSSLEADGFLDTE